MKPYYYLYVVICIGNMFYAQSILQIQLEDLSGDSKSNFIEQESRDINSSGVINN